MPFVVAAQVRALLHAIPQIVSNVSLRSHRDLLSSVSEVLSSMIGACAATPLESAAFKHVSQGGCARRTRAAAGMTCTCQLTLL